MVLKLKTIANFRYSNSYTVKDCKKQLQTQTANIVTKEFRGRKRYEISVFRSR